MASNKHRVECRVFNFIAKMSLTQQNSTQMGAQKILFWLFFILAMLYIVYSSHHLIEKERKCISDEENLKYLTNISHQLESPAQPDTLLLPQTPQHSQYYDNTELKHIVFGIAASANLWERRKEYVKQWCKSKESRVIVWMDRKVKTRKSDGLPEIRVSEDTSRFKYTHRQGHRSAIRISRVVSETLKLGLKDVRWFIMGDDDTVFIMENVVSTLSKYDHRQFYYIGSSSESHMENIFFSYNMAFGGGGFAISYPLAQELAKTQGKCIQRYPGLYGSDDRIQACMAEIGVPLTKETGFHQCDVYGDLLGLLASHPVTPLVSLHHLDVVEPVFPRMTRVKAIEHLFTSVRLDSGSVMQQSICYDKRRLWSISVSWGFVVQIYRGVISPRELEMPSRTFLNWFRRADYTQYAFNTRPVAKHPCLKPFTFYMNTSKYDRARKQTVGIYARYSAPNPICQWKMTSPEKIKSVVVVKRPDSLRWQKSPRRDCCRLMPTTRASVMNIWVGSCGSGEISEL